ncbi:phospholipase/carboxylesterase [Pedobacter sp. CAN_A7]|uniref:alpha/beta hydrolase n=1 Tax=Pedobacter sp. CAN_A7 TaxID=2787722 RepID=UPI0018CA96AB
MENTNQYEATKGEQLVLQYKVKLPVEQAEKPALILLMHGVGSNEEDMFQLADQFNGNVIVVSARAPFVIATGRYAWFTVDFSTGVRRINEEQAEKSRQTINLFINQLCERYMVNKDRVYLGGFSQGGIMAYSVGLTYPQKFAGIFAFSSRLLTEIRHLIKSSKELEHLKLFMAHGTLDQTLVIEYSREAKAYLSPLLPKLEYHEYEMAHTIINQELEDFKKWLGDF